jgi:L-threonylcarbamoyladenylate synthase
MATDVRPADEIQHAVSVLLAGGLVAFPTETVYGLGADADRPEAVRGIFSAKGRPADHPLIVHIADQNAVDAWAADVPEAARTLMQRFWPGPLTVVLPRSARASNMVTGGQDTVGLRCPSHPWAQALLGAFCAARGDHAAALAAPSANRYGRISPTSARHVEDDLGLKPAGRIDCILDGGPCDLGIESTIVDFPQGQVRILRHGSIAAEDIAGCLKGIPVQSELAWSADGRPRVSGAVLAHYAPRKPLRLIASSDLGAAVRVAARPVMVLAPETALSVVRTDPSIKPVIAFTDPDRFARDLYRHLHDFDRSDAAELLVVIPGEGARWLAVTDRLRKAEVGSRS